MKLTKFYFAALFPLLGIALSPATANASQERLLDMAYSAVSAMPLDPHIKNRSREQYKVVGDALKLERPDLAARYAEGIAYWQKGAALADLALYHIEQGDRETGRAYLTKAEKWLAASEQKFRQEGSEQAWRISRVGTGIAIAHAALGEEETVPNAVRTVGKDDAARLLQYKMTQTTPETFDDSVAALSALADMGELESLKSAVNGFAELYNHFYSNETLRKAVRKSVDTYLPKLPHLFQIDLLTELGETAAEHDDKIQALTDADRAAALLGERVSPPRFTIPRMARIADLRWQAGARGKAQKDLAECLRLFNEDRNKIINMDRAGILCSVAAAYAATDNRAQALDVYSMALSEGMVNPNSRPRATDLSRVCRSMATHGIQPSEALFQRLEDMKQQLGEPW